MEGMRRTSFRLAAATAVAALAALVGIALAPGSAASPSSVLGVYAGPANPAGVARFGQWLGRPVTYALDYFSAESWASIESPNWWLDAWATSPYEVVYSVPMLPDSGPATLAAGATGAYDSHWVKLAQTLVAYGQGDAIVRPGWEFSIDAFSWSARTNEEAATYAGYFRRVVQAMRSVSPGFRFVWNPNGGWAPFDLAAAYPGDAYVDVIGLDVYDGGWMAGHEDPAVRWQRVLNGPNGLAWLSSFAASHGKPAALPEWGLWIRSDGHGGGDNTYFVGRMHKWISATNVAFAIYFEAEGDGQHQLQTGLFRLGAARFKELFGSGSSAAPAAPAPPADGGQVYLDSLTPSAYHNGLGPMERA
jgi:Glycosyl hydrolase family 26